MTTGRAGETLPANDACARCGAAFRCGMNDDAPCACTGITLDAATLADLRKRYTGCLCLRCLQEQAGKSATSVHAAG